MSLRSSTRNQHFVAQVEQRLNTSTSWLEKRKQRIYKFEIVKRGTPAEIVLAAPTEPTIKESLALPDLYSFEVVDDVMRHNFEKLFQHFEDDVGRHTSSLLAKIAAKSNDISEEVVSLFAANRRTSTSGCRPMPRSKSLVERESPCCLKRCGSSS